MNLMQVMPGDAVETPIWEEYSRIVRQKDERGDAVIGQIERFAFMKSEEGICDHRDEPEEVLARQYHVTKRCCGLIF